MPCHLEAKVWFFLLYSIRSLLSTSNIDSFARKLLNAKNSRMTKHMVFVCHFVSLLGVVCAELTSFCSVGNLYYWCYGCRLF